MAIGYKELNEAELAWKDNREQISLQARQILRRVLNVALTELSNEFIAGIENGEILEINPGQEELKALLLKASQKELTA